MRIFFISTNMRLGLCALISVYSHETALKKNAYCLSMRFMRISENAGKLIICSLYKICMASPDQDRHQHYCQIENCLILSELQILWLRKWILRITTKILLTGFATTCVTGGERGNEMKIIGIWGILQSGSRPCRNLGLLDSHDLGPLGYFQTPLEERNWASLVKLCQICLKHTWVVQDEELTGIAGTFE